MKLVKLDHVVTTCVNGVRPVVVVWLPCVHGHWLRKVVNFFPPVAVYNWVLQRCSLNALSEIWAE